MKNSAKKQNSIKILLQNAVFKELCGYSKGKQNSRILLGMNFATAAINVLKVGR